MTKKRGRPASGAASGKKIAAKPKASTSQHGSAKKRGRPKKSAATSSGAPSTSANETTATVPAANAS